MSSGGSRPSFPGGTAAKLSGAVKVSFKSDYFTLDSFARRFGMTHGTGLSPRWASKAVCAANVVVEHRLAFSVVEGALIYFHIDNMVFHMKTTLNIADSVMKELKREAVRQGRTMSELVETALRRLFQQRDAPSELPPLPTARSGGHLTDVGNREALYEAMEK